MTRWTVKTLLLPVLGGLLVLAGCETAPEEQAQAPRPEVAQTQAVEILRQISGDHGQLVSPTVRLIKTQAEYQQVVPGGIQGLDINFEQEDLVLLALGQQATGGYWARITGLQRAGRTLYVQGVANAPGPNEMATQAITHPFAAAVIPETRATRARSDIASVRGQQPPRQ